MDSNKQAVIYCRIAKPDQDALERQGAELVNFAEKQGYIAEKIFMDMKTRLSFEKMLEFLSGNPEWAIVTSSRDRLSRDWVLLRELENKYTIITRDDIWEQCAACKSEGPLVERSVYCRSCYDKTATKLHRVIDKTRERRMLQ